MIRLKYHLIQNFAVVEVHNEFGSGIKRVLSVNIRNETVRVMRNDGSVVKTYKSINVDNLAVS